MKLSKRIELWGSSPGSRKVVTVYWPRYLWIQNRTPVYERGRWYPGESATLSEQIRESYRRYPEWRPKHWWQRI